MNLNLSKSTLYCSKIDGQRGSNRIKMKGGPDEEFHGDNL
jgi:hypothetical protein